MRAGNWRLVEIHDDSHTELYNLKADSSETMNLASSQPKNREELLGLLRKWRSDVGAQMATPNPAYDPARAAEGPAPVPRAKINQPKP